MESPSHHSPLTLPTLHHTITAGLRIACIDGHGHRAPASLEPQHILHYYATSRCCFSLPPLPPSSSVNPGWEPPFRSNINCSRSSLPDVRAILRQQVTLKLTYLEINSWVWEVHQQHQAAPLRILVDPLVVGNLDFGMPWLYDGAKKNPKVKALGVDDLLAPDARPDLLLITNRLDDHCHVRTLTQLSARAPDLPVVTTPNARPVLASLPTPFRCVTYLEPGQSTAVSQDVRVLATAGTLLGPPWERPENGYVLFMPAGDDAAADDDRNNGLLYYEPHCLHDRSFLERKRVRADVVITPVVKQLLPLPGNGNYYTLVAGQEDAVDLAGMLRARYVVPMSNADLDAGGLLPAVLTEQGTTQSFQALLSEALPQVQVLDPTPGVPLHLDLDLN